MKNSIQTIIEKLKKYPNVEYDAGEDFIEVLAVSNSGFLVSFEDFDSEKIVSFSGWHEHFFDEKEALNCFAFGLSKKCKLEVHLRGDFEYKWIVHSLEGENWIVDSEVGLLFRPFWKKHSIKVLQNKLWEGR